MIGVQFSDDEVENTDSLDSADISCKIANGMYTTPPHTQFEELEKFVPFGDEIFVFIREPESGSLFLSIDGGLQCAFLD
jgi:hypothetical protein